ncbi:hypothetical protein [Vibrio cholerae]|uniref:hypothetical protein n=1 Tax=Vibrio cholerae TaxID=666 RepID=UPI00292A43DA|nr:hypothetical protein [Vibrio cholerae]
MRPETLLAKFDLRGLNYEQMHNGGGKGLFSLEEQLAIVGVSWKESPVGFLVLFVEVLANKASLKLLQQAVKVELAGLTNGQRGQKSDKAFEAMVAAAIIEATQPLGQICTSCGGTGKYKNASYNLRKCQHCNDGRVERRNTVRHHVQHWFCLHVHLLQKALSPVARSTHQVASEQA